MTSPDLYRARRIVQSIGRQLTNYHEHDIVADRDQAELLWYRLGQLSEALRRADLVLLEGPVLPSGQVALDQEQARPTGRHVFQTATAALKAVRTLLIAAGADPDDRTLDPRQSRREDVVLRILELEEQLRNRGVGALYLFGSVARGDDGPDSDVDIAIDVAAASEASFSLFDLGGIQMDLLATSNARSTWWSGAVSATASEAVSSPICCRFSRLSMGTASERSRRHPARQWVLT